VQILICKKEHTHTYTHIYVYILKYIAYESVFRGEHKSTIHDLTKHQNKMFNERSCFVGLTFGVSMKIRHIAIVMRVRRTKNTVFLRKMQ